MVDHKVEKFAQADSEHTLGKIQLHLVFPKYAKGLLQVLDVLLRFKALDQQVINIHLHVAVNLLFEHFVY